MKIKELWLYTSRIAEQKHFFEKTLGFPIQQENVDTFWVQVGWTKFYFQRSEEDYRYHYCFLIPVNKLHEAIQWLSPKVDIIDADADEKVVFFEDWNAHSFYFYDAAGNLAECIVRHDLQNHSDKPFSITDLLCVNEIGLGTDNITKTNQQLQEGLGTQLWKGDQERFAAIGSQEGLFLLPNYRMKETWFPTGIGIKPNPLTGVIENKDYLYDVSFANGEVQVRKTVYKD